MTRMSRKSEIGSIRKLFWTKIQALLNLMFKARLFQFHIDFFFKQLNKYCEIVF